MKKVIAIMLISWMAIGFVFANGTNEADSAAWAKTVDVIAPVKAGGGTDLAARAIFDKVAKLSGNSIGIVNNDTGNCVVAFEEVRNAEPDGSKILFFNGGFLTRIASGVYNHTVEDFTIIGISHGADPAYALMVSANSGIHSVEDLKAYALANPGKVLFGCNMGGTTQVMGMDLAKTLGVEFKFVHSGSDTATLTELVGGSINVCYANVNQAKQYAESGKAVILGVLGQDNKGTRSPILPEYQNLIELGYDTYFGVYIIVLGPKDMNPELARKIYDYLVQAYNDPDVITLLAPAGLTGVYVPFDEAHDILVRDQASYVEAFSQK